MLQKCFLHKYSKIYIVSDIAQIIISYMILQKLSFCTSTSFCYNNPGSATSHVYMIAPNNLSLVSNYLRNIHTFQHLYTNVCLNQKRSKEKSYALHLIEHFIISTQIMSTYKDPFKQLSMPPFCVCHTFQEFRLIFAMLVTGFLTLKHHFHQILKAKRSCH